MKPLEAKAQRNPLVHCALLVVASSGTMLVAMDYAAHHRGIVKWLGTLSLLLSYGLLIGRLGKVIRAA